MEAAKVWNPTTSAWEVVTNGGNAIQKSILSSRGDIITRDASGPVRLPKGAANSSMFMDAAGNDPAWRTPAQRFKVGSFVCPGATGNKAVTGLGFKPSIVEFDIGWANTTIYSLSGRGVMDASGVQWCTSNWGDPAGNGTYSGSSGCIYLANAAGTSVLLAAFVSMDSDGFTVNFSFVNTSGYIRWIARA